MERLYEVMALALAFSILTTVESPSDWEAGLCVANQVE